MRLLIHSDYNPVVEGLTVDLREYLLPDYHYTVGIRACAYGYEQSPATAVSVYYEGWRYPVQTGGNLSVTQVVGATLSGDTLDIE